MKLAAEFNDRRIDLDGNIRAIRRLSSTPCGFGKSSFATTSTPIHVLWRRLLPRVPNAARLTNESVSAMTNVFLRFQTLGRLGSHGCSKCGSVAVARISCLNIGL